MCSGVCWPSLHLSWGKWHEEWHDHDLHISNWEGCQHLLLGRLALLVCYCQTRSHAGPWAQGSALSRPNGLVQWASLTHQDPLFKFASLRASLLRMTPQGYKEQFFHVQPGQCYYVEYTPVLHCFMQTCRHSLPFSVEQFPSFFVGAGRWRRAS